MFQNKYNKYKYKINNFLQFGGHCESLEFLEKYKDMYMSSTIRVFISKITGIVIDELKNDIIVHILNIICEIFYNSLAEKSKTKKTIVIFSYGTGVGFVEAYFANYLQHNKGIKYVIMLAIEKDLTCFNNNYTYSIYHFDDKLSNGIFKFYNGILNLYNGICPSTPTQIYVTQNEMRLTKIKELYNNPHKLQTDSVNLYNLFNTFDIDIFFAFNPNGNDYNYLLNAYKEIAMKSFSDSRIDVENSNPRLEELRKEIKTFKNKLQRLFYLMIAIKKIQYTGDTDITNYGYIQQYNDIPMYTLVWEDVTGSFDILSSLKNTVNNCLIFFDIINKDKSVLEQSAEFDAFLE
jgi:hypothetical protein